MNCNKCGHSINIDDIYCRFCGNKIGKITKCVVCNSDIFSDTQTCSICGSVQSDYTKCGTCNEINKSSNKYCIGCGNLLTGKKKNIVHNNEAESVKKEYKKIVPTNFNVQNNALNTNNTSKAPIIIAVCAIVIAVIAVVYVSIMSFSNNNAPDDKYINFPFEEGLIEEIINEEVINEEPIDEKTPEIIEDSYYYYNIQFIDNVRVREQPSADSKQVGKISKGSTKIGFSSTDNEGYQWYQIGYNEWVANDGTFLIVNDYITNTEYIPEYHDTVKVNVTKDTGVYNGPGYEYNCTGWMVATSKFQISESIQNEKGEYWLKISPCEYVAYSDVEYIYD